MTNRPGGVSPFTAFTCIFAILWAQFLGIFWKKNEFWIEWKILGQCDGLRVKCSLNSTTAIRLKTDPLALFCRVHVHWDSAGKAEGKASISGNRVNANATLHETNKRCLFVSVQPCGHPVWRRFIFNSVQPDILCIYFRFHAIALPVFHKEKNNIKQ